MCVLKFVKVILYMNMYIVPVAEPRFFVCQLHWLTDGIQKGGLQIESYRTATRWVEPGLVSV